MRHLAWAFVLVSACSKDKAEAPAAKPVATPPLAEVKAPEPPLPPAGPTWERYTSKTGGFSLELPGKGEERTQNTAAGPITIVGAEFGTTASDTRTSMCGATYADMPDGAGDAKQILGNSLARHKENAKVVEEKDETLQTHPGRTLVVENDKHRKWIGAYVVGKRLYLINCGGPFDRAATDDATARRVLASFQLVK